MSMRGFRQFITLSPGQRPLLLRAALVIGAVRIGLWLLPFGTVQQLAARTGRKSGVDQPVERVVWAIKAIDRRIPRATCLTQALAAQVLLARCGHPSSLKIGVAKHDPRGFQAHAWLVSGGRILIGGDEADRYTDLTTWEGNARGHSCHSLSALG